MGVCIDLRGRECSAINQIRVLTNHPDPHNPHPNGGVDAPKRKWHIPPMSEGLKRAFAAARATRAPRFERTIKFTEPQWAWLDSESARLGITVSDLVRRTIDEKRERVVLHETIRPARLNPEVARLRGHSPAMDAVDDAVRAMDHVVGIGVAPTSPEPARE
jgi:hypothetical protein